MRAALLQIDVDVLFAGEAQQFLEALLAADAGLLVAAERRAEEVPGDLVDPDEAGFDLGGDAMGGDEIVGPDRAGQAVFDLR